MPDVLAQLSSWLIDAGGHLDGVAIRERDGMRCVVATRPTAAGSELAQVEALLAGSALATHARNFVLARLGEKRVLKAWLDLATAGPSELFR